MDRPRRISDIPFEMLVTWRNFGRASVFIRERKLWHGFWQYGWVTKFLMLLLVLVGIQFLIGVFNLVNGMQIPGSVDGSLAERLEQLVGGLFLAGSWKYVILILGEVLVFHLMRRTIELIGGPPQDSSFSAFMDAQKRMLAVAFFCWVMELVVTILVSTGLGILGLAFLKPVLFFLIQAYFLGFTLTDNYFERYGLSITQSHKINFQIIGVSLGLGIVLYVLFLLPIVGAVLGTAVGAVTAGMTLHHLENKQHFTFAVMKEKTERS